MTTSYPFPTCEATTAACAACADFPGTWTRGWLVDSYRPTIESRATETWVRVGCSLNISSFRSDGAAFWPPRLATPAKPPPRLDAAACGLRDWRRRQSPAPPLDAAACGLRPSPAKPPPRLDAAACGLRPSPAKPAPPAEDTRSGRRRCGRGWTRSSPPRPRIGGTPAAP